MENLNAEAIKTALKCCDGTLAGCKECPNYNNRYRCNIEAEALALINSQEQKIKELTEENEAWQKQLISTKEQADKAYYELACEVEDLRAENERLLIDKKKLINENAEIKNKIQEAEFTEEELDLIDEYTKLLTEAIRDAKADTVRKMQESITEHATNDYPRKVRLDVIDQIAQEMIGEIK